MSAETPVQTPTAATTSPVESTEKPVVSDAPATPSSASSAKAPTTPSSLPNPPVANAAKSTGQPQAYPQHMQQPQMFVPHMQQHPHQQYTPKNYNNVKGQYNQGYNGYPNYNNHDNYQPHKNAGNRINNNNGGANINNRHNNGNPNIVNNNNVNNTGYKKGGYRNYQPQMYPQQGQMMPMPYYPIPQQYQMPPQSAAALPEKPITSPVKKHTRLSIKTKDGTPVNFTPSHNKSSSISQIPASVSAPATAPESTTTPAAAAAEAAATTEFETTTTTPQDSTTASTSATTSTPAITEEPKEKPSQSKESFREQFLKQLKLKKLAQEKEASPAPVEPPAPAVEETKDSTPAPVVEETKEEETTPAVEEPEVEKKEETTEAIAAPVEETPATTEFQPEEESTPAATEESTSEEKATEESAAESAAGEEETTESTLAPSSVSMTEFFGMVSNAKPVTDAFTFPYSEGFHGPDESLKSRKVITYDPIFLYQFDKIHFDVDEAWKAKYLSKIYIPDKSESRDKSFRGRNDRIRSNGPLKGPLRGEEGRGNSRTGSKRKGREPREPRDPNKSRRGERGERGGSGKSRRGDRTDKVDEKPQIKLAPEEVKPLEKTANRWVPKSQKTAAKEVKYAPDGVTVLLDDEDLEKKIRSLLNKLSLELFDDISNDLLELANQSKYETDANALKMTVRLTFAKATDEPHWSQMYAKFCQKLVSSIDQTIYSEDYKSKENEDGTFEYFKGTNLAYRLLVSRCQTEYEKGWSTELPVNEDGSPIEPELMSDEYYALAAQKRRGLGLVRFIGELYRLKLIQFRVIAGCIRILTTEKDQDGKPKPPSESSDDYLPQEDTLETLNQFLLTVGQPLEVENPACIEYAFQRITTYMNNPKIGSRIKYKFLDLIDLRKAKWRNADSKLAGPKTISQIHDEFNKKQASQDRERSSRSRSSKSNSKWGNDHISSTDISKVGMIRKSDESQINVLRKGKSVTSMVSDFTTVSRNKSTRGTSTPISRSASTSSTTSTLTAATAANPEEESRQQSNRFNLLMDDDDSAHEEVDDDEEEEEEEELELETADEVEAEAAEEEEEESEEPETAETEIATEDAPADAE